MSTNKKTVTVFSITLIFALGVGVAIGAMLKNKGFPGQSPDNNNNATPVANANFQDLSLEELSSKLSEVMLPEEEFSKLEGAIFQTAMGLLVNQAQQAGLTVTDATQDELKKSINEKYTRKYFADMNASSMQELSKDELILIIGFYNTEAGQKFLKLSPKIIKSTMAAVQADLSAWLPKTVGDLIARLKGEPATGDPAAPKDAPMQEAPEKNEASGT